MKTWLLLMLLGACQLATAQPMLKVRLGPSNGTGIVEMPLERYVVAALAGESGGFQSEEALKAMAVAARTYAVRMRARHAAEGFDLCDTTHCQRLDIGGSTPRLEKAAADTAGELLWYQGKPAFTPYTKDCGGTTEDAAAVWPDLAEPYLKSHKDPYCTHPTAASWHWSADPHQIQQALRQSSLSGPQVLARIAIATRTPSGRASTLMLTGGSESVRISASSFRFALGRELGWNTIRSDRYEVTSSGGHLRFDGAGDGHGVGLCQRGAEQMGLLTLSYHEILAFYYPGTKLGLTAQGLSWQTLGGDTLSMQTTNPDQDRAVLAAAERLTRTLSARVKWTMPTGVVIRVYPDLDTFRNATGEPGWVAAHTEGGHIDLQPVALLRSQNALDSTLSHELLHALIELRASRSASNLPEWFREGLVGYLEGEAKAGKSNLNNARPSDADLRQTTDQDKARRAYAQAAAAVAGLVQTYGESAVLDWAGRGLPREVTNASTSHETPKSK
jgi:stage II sporulation protein D